MRHPPTAPSSGSAPPTILEPGRTCWRLEPAERVAFLVDGAAYFAAARQAMLRARRQIILLGWDFDTRIDLEPGAVDGAPRRIGALLDWLTARRPDLHIHVLKWNFAMIFALEREMLPTRLLDWTTNERISFRLDGEHPVGGSQHQKVLVIDDAVAFCGGLDLTAHRWDTRAHRDVEPARITPGGRLYRPFHDAMMMVDGAAARALGALARERWLRATGERLDTPSVDGDLWPAAIRPDLCRVPVAIARTLPAWRDWAAVREVEALYLAAIAAARRSIYIECQYLASFRIGQALLERLAERCGPEVVVVGPKRTDGWLEEEVMGAARDRIVDQIRKFGGQDRFAVFYPRTPGGIDIMVHSKIMIVDDRLLRIGSSNLNNRSMGLDSECDLAIEAVPGGSDEYAVREAIGAFRDGLLAEHLGRTRDEVATAYARCGSMIATIHALTDLKGRHLAPLRVPHLDDGFDLVADTALLDPERPVRTEELMKLLTGDIIKPSPRVKAAIAAFGAVLLCAGLFAIWRLTGLSDFATLDQMLDHLQALGRNPAGPLVLVMLFILGGLAFFPVTVLIAATAIVMGPVLGFVTALAGCLASAAVSFWVGRRAGRGWLERFGGNAVNRVSHRLAARGILTVAVLRVVPVAPFAVINIVAGASHLRLTDFLIGTLMGMAPGTLAFSVFGDQLEEALRNPDPASFVILAAIGAVAVGLGWVADRVIGRRIRRITRHGRESGLSGRGEVREH